MAAVVDLGIDRQQSMAGESFKLAAMKNAHGDRFVQRTPTLEEYRTLAGVFYLTSTVATSFRKIEAIPYSKYLEECMTSLLHTREYDSDALLVQIVRLQSIAQEAHTTETSSAPIQMYINAFVADLDREHAGNQSVRNEGDNDLRLEQLQFLTCKIHCYELSLNQLQQQDTNKASSRAALRAHLPDLYCLMEAIQAFTDLFFTIPIDEYLTTTFAVWGQFAHCFMVLSKLASLEIDGWDYQSCHTRFVKIVDEATSYYDRAGQSSPDGLTVINDSFAKWANKLRFLKSLHLPKILDRQIVNDDHMATAPMQSATQPGRYEQVAVVGGAQQQPTPPDDWLPPDFFGIDDWNSLIADADFGFAADQMMQT